jgi:hypothetical protein
VVSNFAMGVPSPVALTVTDDGSLYYLTRGLGGAVYRVMFTGDSGPSIATQPSDHLVSVGGSASFTVAANGADPLSYQWQRERIDIPDATSATYVLANATMNDNGRKFRVKVSNPHGSAFSDEATLRVTTDQPPDTSITQPLVGAMYSAGQTIHYAGTANDPETGDLPASAFTWRVDFHHADHVHPFIPPTAGSKNGSFVVPNTGHTESDVFLRISLTVHDPAGLKVTIIRDVHPRTVEVTLATVPAGLTVKLDDQPKKTPLSFIGVVGVQRTLEAVSPQLLGGKNYEFEGWSDGGAQAHTVTTPISDTTYTARFHEIGDGLTATYFDDANVSGSTVKRIDNTIDFNWGNGAPVAGFGADTFSVRWVGSVQPPRTGTYTFYTQSDDGVRLWINGKPVVSNWSKHTLTENSGTVSLTGGARYAIRLEYYDDSGPASARLLWSGPSVAKTVVPRRALYSSYAQRINFQPANAAVPAGYLADAGAVFGVHGNGERYGWNTSNAGQGRDRNAANSPDQRYDTFELMQAPTSPSAVWELLVPNGTYTVRVVAGDPIGSTGSYRIDVDGVEVVSGTPTLSTHWFDGTASVTVSDNRLTVTSGSGAVNNKICFIDIS